MFSWVVTVFTQEEFSLISIFTSYHDTETRFFGNLTPLHIKLKISLWENNPSKKSGRSSNVFFWGPFLCILAVYRMFLPKFTSCDLACLLRGKKSMRRSATVVGSEILAPVDMVDFPFFTGFYTSQVVVWDFWTISIIGDIRPAKHSGRSWCRGAAPWEEKKCWNPQYCLLQKCCYNWLKKPHEWKWFFALKRMDFPNVILVF